MEVAEQRVAPGQRHAQCGVQDLGELCVEGGGKRQAAAPAVAPRRPAQRSFGRDVDGVGLRGADHLRQAPPRQHGDVDARIARTGPGAELARVDDHDLVPRRLQLAHQLHQRGDHAIDLGRPGVGHEHELHRVSVRMLVVRRWHQAV